MLGAGFEAEDVARQMEGIDLSAAVAQQLVRTDGAGHDLVEAVGLVAFGEEFLVLGQHHRRARRRPRSRRRPQAESGGWKLRSVGCCMDLHGSLPRRLLMPVE